jgi:hypothetical protein
MKAVRRRYGHMAPAALDKIEGYETKFYSSDRHEPPHVHVYKNGPKIKFWLFPNVRLAKPVRRVKAQELRRAKEIVEENRETIVARWASHFGLSVNEILQRVTLACGGSSSP